jgi:hypothetical protein
VSGEATRRESPVVFLAGIIQGSHRGLGTFDQGYRERLKTVLRTALPECELICPVEEHPQSVRYSDERARDTFLANVERAKQSDAIVVYLPEASMGSSIEMWEAHRRGVPVLTITPMDGNWVVRILSNRVFPDVDAFESFAASGELGDLLRRKPR